MAASRKPEAVWWDQPFWRGARVVAELAGALGVGLIAVQLVLGELSNRTANAFDYIDRFNEPQLRAARDRLAAVTAGYNARLEELGVTDGLDQEQIDTIALAETFGEGPGPVATRAALVQVAEFMDEAALCVEAGLCRRKAVCHYFRNYAADLNRTFGAAVKEYGRLNGAERFGRGLRRIAGYQCNRLF
jgi:hypothetical protein